MGTYAETDTATHVGIVTLPILDPDAKDGRERTLPDNATTYVVKFPAVLTCIKYLLPLASVKTAPGILAL